MIEQRTAENTKSGIRAALVGWLTFYAFPGSGYLFTVLNKDIYSTLDPANIESFIVGSLAALGITGGVGSWYRDKTSPKQINASPTRVEKRLARGESSVATGGLAPIQVNAGESAAQPTREAEVEPPTFSEPAAKPATPKKKNWFTNAELDCKCQDLPDCDYRGMDAVTMRLANELREQFGPLFVNSAYRCPEHNRNVGGSPNSYHPKGKAIDLRSPTHSPQVMYDWLNAKYPNKYGIGNYRSFIHLDSRSDSWARKSGPEKGWQSYALPDLELA